MSIQDLEGLANRRVAALVEVIGFFCKDGTIDASEAKEFALHTVDLEAAGAELLGEWACRSLIRLLFRNVKISGMKAWIKDTAGLGSVLWLLGYLASMVLFFSPFAEIMGWIITAVFTPVTIAIAWWWFRARRLPLSYYVKIGIVWTLIAVVFDYLFIVLLFQAEYYRPDVFVYYALTFLIPVGVGLYLVRVRGGPETGKNG